MQPCRFFPCFSSICSNDHGLIAEIEEQQRATEVYEKLGLETKSLQLDLNSPSDWVVPKFPTIRRPAA